MSGVLGWHFIRADMCLGFGDGRKAQIGKWLSVEGEPCLYSRGLHASGRAIDALEYSGWESTVVCRVELGGTIVHGGKTMVAQRRRILWAAHADAALRDFALDCGTRALQAHYPDAPDALWHALDLRSAIAEGIEVDHATWDAAWAAACAAARGAARDAAKAAARTAAYDVAKAAAWDAAWAVHASATSDVASDAANDTAETACDATASTVQDAQDGWAAANEAWDVQNRHLEERLFALDRVSP